MSQSKAKITDKYCQIVKIHFELQKAFKGVCREVIDRFEGAGIGILLRYVDDQQVLAMAKEVQAEREAKEAKNGVIIGAVPNTGTTNTETEKPVLASEPEPKTLTEGVEPCEK